jgi:hypothetical protein
MNLSSRRYEHAQIPNRSDGAKLGRWVCAGLILAVPLLFVPRASAGTLFVGPIDLTGAGSFYDPDPALGEGLPGTVGVAFSASGSNGADSVSISVSEVDQGGYIGFPIVGSTMRFSAGLNGCLVGFSSIFPSLQCVATIDGITGIGSFTNLGGGAGIVQVYQEMTGPPECRGCPEAGPMLGRPKSFRMPRS